ncbi:MAG: MFS transporter [Mesorhizobium sp.]
MAGIAALTFAYVLSQFFRTFLAVLSPSLMIDLGLTKADLSIASGAWFAAFAASQFGVGVALDRFGPRKTAAVLLAICGGGGALVFAGASDAPSLTLAMALIGIGSSPVLMASVFIFAHAYSPARMAILTSSVVGIGSLGNVAAAAPLAAAAQAFGWRGVLVVLAVVTVATAAAILAFVRDPKIENHGPSSGFAGYVELLKLKVLWPLIPITAINYAPPVGIRGLWAGPFLTDVYQATTTTIGHVTLAMALAMVAGNFIYGPLDQIFRTRKWVAIAGNLVSLSALIWLVLRAGQGMWGDAAAFAVIGVAGASYGLLMAHARAFLPPHLTGRGVTLMNFFSIGGVGVMQFATGAVVTSSTVSGDPLAAYTALFTFYAGMLALSIVIYLAVRDAPPKA